MIINGYLIRVTERKVEDDNHLPKMVYSAFLLDDDDKHGAAPLKISLNTLEEALKLRQHERAQVSVTCYSTQWSFEGRRGNTYRFVCLNDPQQELIK